LNSLGFWLYLAGAILMNFFFMVGGEFAAAAGFHCHHSRRSRSVPAPAWIMDLEFANIGLGSLIGG